MSSTLSFTEPISVPLPFDGAGRVRFTREHYDRMIEAGVLTKEDRVELLDGEIVSVSPIGPYHSSLLDRLTEFFIESAGGRYSCRVQGPLALSDSSEPEPDLMLLRRARDRYRHRHPEPSDVLMLIEVAQTSLARDLGSKLALYAAANIAEYWVVDADLRRVIVHRVPSAGVYTDVQTFAAPEKIAPQAFTDTVVDLAELFE